MKTSKLLVITLFTAFSMFAFSPVKADAPKTTQQNTGLFGGLGNLLGGLLGGGSSQNQNTGKTSGTSLPIDNHIWFLIVAAGVVGCKVIISKSKAVKVQAVKVRR